MTRRREENGKSGAAKNLLELEGTPSFQSAVATRKTSGERRCARRSLRETAIASERERHDEGDVARERGVKIRVKRRRRKGSSWGRERKGRKEGGREGRRQIQKRETKGPQAGRKQGGREGRRGRVDSLVAWMDLLSVEEEEEKRLVGWMGGWTDHGCLLSAQFGTD